MWIVRIFFLLVAEDIFETCCVLIIIQYTIKYGYLLLSPWTKFLKLLLFFFQFSSFLNINTFNYNNDNNI
jgi:hypothetical protein